MKNEYLSETFIRSCFPEIEYLVQNLLDPVFPEIGTRGYCETNGPLC